jgi:hypothetical protein
MKIIQIGGNPLNNSQQPAHALRYPCIHINFSTPAQKPRRRRVGILRFPQQFQVFLSLRCHAADDGGDLRAIFGDITYASSNCKCVHSERWSRIYTYNQVLFPKGAIIASN